MNSVSRSFYSCSCGKAFPLEDLFFCVSCDCLKCIYCVNQEVVAVFCSNCLDNVSSNEVMANKSRCTKCFVCPVCESNAKIVSEGSACFLRCTYCPWNTKQTIIAPGVSDLLQLVSQLEEDNSSTALFKERLASYSKEVEETVALRSQQQQSATLKRAQSLLAHTPAKDKYFSRNKPLDLSGPLPVMTSLEEDAPASPAVETDAVARLEAKQAAKNKAMFPQPSAMEVRNSAKKGSFAGKSAETLAPLRQQLMSATSKHCRSCDKLLVKSEVNPNTPLDKKFKRLHVGWSFVVLLELTELKRADKTASLKLCNPMKHVVAVELHPLSGKRAQMTLLTKISLSLGVSKNAEVSPYHPS